MTKSYLYSIFLTALKAYFQLLLIFNTIQTEGELFTPLSVQRSEYILLISRVFGPYCKFWTVHSPLFFRKIIEVERFALRAAILHECQNYLGGIWILTINSTKRRHGDGRLCH